VETGGRARGRAHLPMRRFSVHRKCPSPVRSLRERARVRSRGERSEVAGSPSSSSLLSSSQPETSLVEYKSSHPLSCNRPRLPHLPPSTNRSSLPPFNLPSTAMEPSKMNGDMTKKKKKPPGKSPCFFGRSFIAPPADSLFQPLSRPSYTHCTPTLDITACDRCKVRSRLSPILSRVYR
jgi:hypothetical protein